MKKPGQQGKKEFVVCTRLPAKIYYELVAYSELHDISMSEAVFEVLQKGMLWK